MTTELDAAKAKAAATYNAAADHFDDPPNAYWQRHGRRTIEMLALRAGTNVLDVCCGTGDSALPAAEAVGPTGSVLGVDLAENLLAIAREKARARGLRNVEFKVGDMTSLGLPSDAFDAVVIVFGIFFVPDMEAQVRELWRMVRPGGKLAVTTWGPRIFEPLYTVWREEVRRERPDLYSGFNPWDRITDPSAVEKLLVDGGASNIEVVAEDDEQPLSSPEDWWTVVIGSGLRWPVEQMGPEAAERVRNANLTWARARGVRAIETNAIYAIATK